MDDFRTRRALQLSEDLNTMLEEDAAATMADLEDDAVRLYYAREERRDMERNEKTIDDVKDDYGRMGRLRRWLLDHPGEFIEAAEYGVRAFLKSAGVKRLYDRPSVIKMENPRLFDRLVALNCLEIDDKMVQACIANKELSNADLAGYRHEVERAAPSLVTERKQP